ncbi:MAG: phosphatase PAP2 family protein [Paludibacteraceae bacterium]|nr:phosphatase PAP2 family protein [Paludibacteraceae bacterium]
MTTVLDWLDGVDKALFLALNGHHNAFFDGFMWLYSDKWVWLPFYLLLIFLMVNTARKNAVWYLLFVVLAIVAADQLASGWCKPFFARLRPLYATDLQGLVHSVAGADLYGFMSSHAANCFALAMFTSLYFKRKSFTITMFAWAALNAYSRIYLGMHYPGDLLAGALSGMGIAWGAYALAHWLVNRRRHKALQYQLSRAEMQSVWLVLGVTVFLLGVCGRFLF